MRCGMSMNRSSQASRSDSSVFFKKCFYAGRKKQRHSHSCARR
nr:MAG TPA: hypothetical protein [Caudoviricetes sp.]